MFDPFDPNFLGSMDPKTREFFAQITGQGCAICRERKGLREFPPNSKQLVCGNCAMKIALGEK